MKITCNIYALYMSHMNEYVYVCTSSKYGEDSSFIFIEAKDIEFTPPPNDVITARTVEAFQRELVKIRAEAEVKRQNIQAQIDRLLCIEHKAEA